MVLFFLLFLSCWRVAEDPAVAVGMEYTDGLLLRTAEYGGLLSPRKHCVATAPVGK
jgi:hypothetical protein